MLGISPDESEACEKFAGKYDLDFTLLADPDHAVADAYGAWGEKSMYGKKYMGVLRSTFIIDPEGKIARVFPKVQPKKHDDLVLKALAELTPPDSTPLRRSRRRARRRSRRRAAARPRTRSTRRPG